MQERKPCIASITLDQFNVILQIFNEISIENYLKVWTLVIFINLANVCYLCCSRLTYDHSKGYVFIRNGYQLKFLTTTELFR